MNVGDGVPVTIRSIEGVRKEQCPHESKRIQHSNDFKKRMSEFADRIDTYKADMLKMVAKLSKKDQQEMKQMIEQLSQEVRSNIPFYEDQFTRQMNKTVVEAKAEVEAFVNNKIMSTGLAALKGNHEMLQIEEGK